MSSQRAAWRPRRVPRVPAMPSWPPPQRHEAILFFSFALHGDPHLLAGLTGAERERVVVDVVDRDTVEFHDRVAALDPGLVGRPAGAHARQEHTALGLHVVGNGAEIGAVSSAAGDAALGAV